MADDKNKKRKNITSTDKLTLSLENTNLNSKPGSSSTTKTAYTLALSNKNGNLILNIQTESSERQHDSHRQTKPITAGPKSSPQASKPHSNLNTGQKNSPHASKAHPLNSGQKCSPNASKTHPNLTTGPKKSPNASKTHTNLNSGPKNSPNASKTHPNVNTAQKSAPHHSNTHHNSNTGPKKSNHAPKAHPNLSAGQKNSPPAVKTYSNYNVEQKTFKNTFKPHPNFNSGPQSSPLAFTTHSNWSTGHENVYPGFTTHPNWVTGHKNSPAPLKIHPNLNNFALSNSPAHLHGSWNCGLDSDRYQIKDMIDRKLQEMEQRNQPPASRTHRARSASRPRHNTNENELNCPTCKTTFLPQIYQCASGHSSCSNCKEKGWSCGICGQVITDMRNFALEGFLAEKKVLCPHNIEGCKLFIKMSEMDVHVKECPFGLLECPAGCSYKMPLKQLSGHFNDQHPGQRLAGVGSEVEIRYIYEPSQKMYLVQVGAFHFLFHEWVSPQDHRIYMAAQLIGTKVSASKWFYEVNIYNKNEPHRVYTFSETCTSFVEPVFDIFNEGKCCILTQKRAVTFLNKAAVNYKVFIKKVVANKPQIELCD